MAPTDERVTESDVVLPGGGTLHVYDTDPGGGATTLAVSWHHGTPNVGAPPRPLFAVAAGLGIRFVSHDRPSYGRSSPRPGRVVSDAARDVEALADALGLDRFAVLSHSGGGPHALAVAALLPDRVVAAALVSSLAPPDAEGLDWFARMAPAGRAELTAAREGPGALRALLESSEFDPESFTPADHSALAGEWSWFGGIAAAGVANGLDGMVDDDRAYVRPWGFDVEQVGAPVLLVHGVDDRIVPVAHADWLARRLPDAESWRLPGDGHLSPMRRAGDALAWLAAHA